MARLGELYTSEQSLALRLGNELGWLMASEVLGVGLDMSFAPVLDVDRSNSRVIGDRAFSQDPQAVVAPGRGVYRRHATGGYAQLWQTFPRAWQRQSR